jgi:hypothetical protein
MSETLVGREAFANAHHSPESPLYPPLEEANYVYSDNDPVQPKRMLSESPMFDELMAQHPELANLDFVTKSDTPQWYTPIEEKPARTLDDYLAETSSFPRIEELVGDKIQSNEDFINEGLHGAAAAESVTSTTEKVNMAGLVEAMEQRRHSISQRIARKATEDVVEAPGKRGLRSRIAARFRRKEALEEASPETRVPKQKRRAFGRVALAATSVFVLAGAVGAGMTWDKPSQNGETSSHSRINGTSPSAESTPTPQPTVETVKPEKTETPKRALKDDKDNIVYAEVDKGGSIWEEIKSELPKRAQDDATVNDIKNEVLEVRKMSQKQGNNVKPGFKFSFKIPR